MREATQKELEQMSKDNQKWVETRENGEYQEVNDLDFSYLVFKNLRFDFVKFNNVEFYESKFNNSKFNNSKFNKTEFNNSIFIGSEFNNSIFIGSEFHCPDFKSSKFINCIGVGSRQDEIDNAKKLLEILSKEENELKMDKWHTCKTAHCLAGWMLLGVENPSRKASCLSPHLSQYFYRDEETAIEGLIKISKGEF
jgi:hypothetical protein